jgi:hypothetical protein
MTCDDIRDKCMIDCVLSVYLREIDEVSAVMWQNFKTPWVACDGVCGLHGPVSVGRAK